MDTASQISVGVILSSVGMIAGIIGAYVRLKSDINVQHEKTIQLKEDIEDLHNRKKEAVSALHKRVDSLKTSYTTLQKEVHEGHKSLETIMAEKGLRMFKEFIKALRELIQEFKN